MLNRDNYIQLINNALKNQNNEIRSKSEAQLVQLRDSNPNHFFQQCAEILADQNSDEFLKRSAGTLLSRSTTLKFQRDNNSYYYWDALDIQVKQKVKQAALSTLINSNITIVKAGANVISSIAFIEVPRNQWLNIIDILAENTTNQNPSFRQASVIAIGFICQQLHYGHAQINLQTCQQFLGGIIIGTRQKQNKNIVQTSLVALRNSISFLIPILTEQAVRNQVFNVLISNIRQQSLIQTVYQGFFQFAKGCYDYLGPYLNNMMEFVVNHIRQRNNNTLFALQLIDTIGIQYLDKVQEKEQRTQNQNIANHLITISPNLIPQVMKCFLIQSQEDLQFSQMRNSASKTLGTMVASGNRSTVDTIINGVAAVVKSDVIGHQQASAILLATLCEYSKQDKAYAEKYINDAFQPVIGLLNSRQEIVIMNTLAGFITIAEYYPQQFYERSTIVEIVQKLFNLIPYSPRIGEAVLKIFLQVSQGFDQKRSNVLVSQPQVFIKKIVGLYQSSLQNFTNQNKSYADVTSNILINCLMRLQNRETLNHMIDYLINKYQYFYTKQVYNKSDHQIIQQSILTLINTSVLKQENFLPNMDLIGNICQVLNSHINRFGLDYAFIETVGAMIVCYKNAFEQRADNYWKQVLHGLEMIDNQQTFKASLATIGDYSRQYNRNFQDKLNPVLTRLFQLLHQNIQRKLKIPIIYCIADMLLGMGVLVEVYIDDILRICDLCFNAVYSFLDNPQEKQYMEELKKAIIQFYACFTFALYSTPSRHRPNQKSVNYFQRVFEFILRTCESRQIPTIVYLKSCLYFITDQIGFFSDSNQLRPMLAQILNSSELKILFKQLEKWESREDIRDLQKQIDHWYQVIINSMA